MNERGKRTVGLGGLGISAMLLLTGCYTGVEGFDADADPDAPPPGAGDDAGDEAGDDDGEPNDDDGPCRTAGTTATRLLTAAEYEHSVHRMLGVSTEVRSRLPVDEVVGESFTHNGKAKLDVSELRKYMQVAEDLAAEVVVADLLPCEAGETAEAQLACAEQLVRELGRQAYRRPLSDDEVLRWLEVYQGARDDAAIQAGFQLAIRTVVAGMLQSSFFLMVTEVGEVRDDTPEGLRSLTAHELAAKLAYLVWDDLPDQELAALADAGTLVDPEVLEAQTRRMFEDPRARAGLPTFFRQWLRSDAVLASGNVDAPLQESMLRETELLIEHVLWGDDAEGTVDELLTADYTFVDAELAAHYGLEAEGLTDAPTRVTLPPERRGVLGHGSLLASYGEHSASVYRGLHVYRGLMCRPTAPPPAQLDTTIYRELTPREAAEARIDNPTCTQCHGGFEATALALEEFDASGRLRETYEDGTPVDAVGWWPAPDPWAFEGLAGLSTALAGNEEVERCAAQHAAEFAFGEDAQLVPGEERHCVAASIQDAFVDSGGDLRELLVNLVLSDAFRLRDPEGHSPTCE